MRIPATVLLLLLSACDTGSDIASQDELVHQIERMQVGHSADQWIEMSNNAGEWERTGLIFGYSNDLTECKKAIAGLQAANFSRMYRCTPAN